MTKPKETAPETAAFDVAAFLAEVERPANYLWREIEREGDDLPPLRVKMLDVTIQQTEAIPWGARTPLRDSLQAIAPYVVEWTLTATNRKTGEEIAVPPPAEAGWEVFELLTNLEAGAIVNWLKVPQFMKAEAEKKSSTPSTSTSRGAKRKS